MILCFWLVILFLDGAFSYKHSVPTTPNLPPTLSSPSLQEPTDSFQSGTVSPISVPSMLS
jgi:hypothetical protein